MCELQKLKKSKTNFINRVDCHTISNAVDNLLPHTKD